MKVGADFVRIVDLEQEIEHGFEPFHVEGIFIIGDRHNSMIFFRVEFGFRFIMEGTMGCESFLEGGIGRKCSTETDDPLELVRGGFGDVFPFLNGLEIGLGLPILW